MLSLKILTAGGDFVDLSNACTLDEKLTYSEMLKQIVTIAKNNGFIIDYKEMFNGKFYNIALIETDHYNIIDTILVKGV